MEVDFTHLHHPPLLRFVLIVPLFSSPYPRLPRFVFAPPYHISHIDETVFYKKIDALKTSSKGKDSKTTLFISDDFYDQAKLLLDQDEGLFESMSKKDFATTKRKQWTQKNGKIQDKNGRVFVPK